MSAAQLVSAVVKALREEDIRFTGTPKVVRRPPSKGLFVTDHKRLFVKVTDTDPTTEWIGARHGASSGVPGPRPVHKPIALDGGQWLLPFRWLQGEDGDPDGKQVAETMARIWAAPPPLGAPVRPWEAYESQARANIAAGANASRPVQIVLHRLVDTAISSVHARLREMPVAPAPVWTHGDLRGRNMSMVAGRVHVLDWERHGVSIREHEVAKYLQTLLSEPEEARAMGECSEFLHAVERLGVDVDLAWRLTGLRATGAAGFLSSFGPQNPHADWLAMCVDLAHRCATQPPPV